MRKFLMAAALLAVVACGEKNKNAADTTTAAPAMTPPAMTSMDSLKRDSVVKDSMRKDSVMKHDSAMKPPAKP